MDAAKGDDIGFGFRRAVSEAERIADVVGQLLDLGDLVVVCEDDGVALFFEAADFVGQKHGGTMDPRAAGGNQSASLATSSAVPTE